MISKNELKLLTSLQQKKYRQKHKLFVAEGAKLVNDLLHSSFVPFRIYAVDNFVRSNPHLEITPVDENTLERISTQKNPHEAVAIFQLPKATEIQQSGLILVLDGVNDPGNLGTILRSCDWFGIESVICSQDTVDAYNPKVVQASMGSIARVKIHYTDLKQFLSESKLPVYFTTLEGKNIYEVKLPKEAIIVMGNEANGISSVLYSVEKQELTIPKFETINTVESLNVAVATAIILNEFRR
jgi:TrmH family RNA methyltransferase